MDLLFIISLSLGILVGISYLLLQLTSHKAQQSHNNSLAKLNKGIKGKTLKELHEERVGKKRMF